MVGRLKSHDEIEGVRASLTALAAEGKTDELIEVVIALLGQMRDDNTRLRVKLEDALRALFGRKSEKVSKDQLMLAFAELAEAVPAGAQEAVAEEPEDDPEKPKEPRRRGGGRKPLPKDLPREPRTVRVPEGLRTCPECGCEKELVGCVRSEVLEFVPAHFKIIDERREKLACRTCGEGVVVADTTKPMDRGRPGPGLLAHIVSYKGQDAQPLYRQSQIYARAGVKLSRSTLGDWHAFACDVLRPLASLIRMRVLSDVVVGADDTGLRVLDRRSPNGVKLGHMWAYVGSGMVCFDYTPTWEATGPMAFLEGYRGKVQGDGYAGFKTVLRERERGDPIVAEEQRLGCGMHIRRKFEAAQKAGDPRGAIALAYFRRVYDVERSCKEDGLDDRGRKARRDELSMPIVDELYDWVRRTHDTLVPDSRLYAATRYALNQEAAFRRCFADGRFEIDNGEAERQLRRVALGRKNYLFAGSDAGAKRLATLYSVLGSCHMAGLDPLAYLTDVIDKLQNGWPKSRLGEVLPDAWQPPARPDGNASPEASPAPAAE